MKTLLGAVFLFSMAWLPACSSGSSECDGLCANIIAQCSNLSGQQSQCTDSCNLGKSAASNKGCSTEFEANTSCVKTATIDCSNVTAPACSSELSALNTCLAK